MRSAITLLLLISVLYSCGGEKILLNNVESLSMEIDHNESINVGSTFEYRVYAKLRTGETKRVKNDNFILFPGKSISDAGEHRALINEPLHNIDDSTIAINYSLTIGTYEVQQLDTLSLNFKGPIMAKFTEGKGKNGSQPRASSSTLFGRDGLEGRPGGNGAEGTEGRHLTGYLWEESDELRMVLICDSTHEKFYYRSLRRDTVIIDVSGNDGGNGAIGGTGGDGKNGKTGKDPGNGGDGGIGGNGGHGGDGGSVVLFVHPDVVFLDHSILLINNGGKGGKLGSGGVYGKAGKSINGQPKASDGILGKNGVDGKDGVNGPTITISKVAFDYKRIVE